MSSSCRTQTAPRVALLAEGVDRNCPEDVVQLVLRGSPSSRRAWIEISIGSIEGAVSGVALLAEGVDRNSIDGVSRKHDLRSPSSRRAWIEIASTLASKSGQGSRPPRGGRG